MSGASVLSVVVFESQKTVASLKKSLELIRQLLQKESCQWRNQPMPTYYNKRDTRRLRCQHSCLCGVFDSCCEQIVMTRMPIACM